MDTSHGIVHNHGGEILVASQPGEGAIFTILQSISANNALASPSAGNDDDLSSHQF